jgi:hypothetical protein
MKPKITIIVALSVSQLTGAGGGDVGVGQFMYYGNEKKVSVGNHEDLITKAVQQYSNYNNNGFEQQFQGVPYLVESAIS